MKKLLCHLCALFCVVLISSCDRSTRQSDLTVAVASNFANTATMLFETFENEAGISVTIVSGSTGKLAAHIQQGAPFDAFLAADHETPAKLAENGEVIPYALGRLALVGRDPDLVARFRSDAPSTFGATFGATFGEWNHIAIANPAVAPYGRASVEVLKTLGIWETIKGKVVQGENIAQAWHFVESGNADLGFVALSQLTEEQKKHAWIIPDQHFTPITQSAIVLNDGENARRLIEFLQSPTARDLIRSAGYHLPPLDSSHAQ